MKVYAFTDLHGNLEAFAKAKAAIAAEKPDLILFAGDLTVFERDMEPLLRKLNSLGPPVLLLHGNHEEEAHMRRAAAQFPNLVFLHLQAFAKDGWLFLGHGGGGFDERYPELEEFARNVAVEDWQKVVFLSHAPPYGTAVDNVSEEDEWHVGSVSLRDVIERYQPRLVLCGHIHECFRKQERIGATLVANPGPHGKAFTLERV